MKPVHSGKAFEDSFETQCKVNMVTATRIPDGCRQLGKKIIRVKTPWDWVASFLGTAALIDTKTTQEKTFPHSKIDENQVKAMLPHCCALVPAGYVIELKGSDAVIFVSANVLSTRIYRVGSISANDPGVLYLGTCAKFSPRKIMINHAKLTRQSEPSRV